MLKIFKYIIIPGSFLFCFILNVVSQNKAKEEDKEPEIALYQGLKVEIEAFSAVMSVVNSETYSFEGNIQLNLKEKYFPVVEIGFAGANKTSPNDYHFKTSGFFTRIGFDYNLLAPNEPDASIKKYFLIGARYSFSPFNYDITNVKVIDDYWGGEKTVDFKNQFAYKHWAEVVGGLRVEFLNNIYLGWSVRLKVRIGKEKAGDIEPWYIPGIGISSTGNWGFCYAVGYRF